MPLSSILLSDRQIDLQSVTDLLRFRLHLLVDLYNSAVRTRDRLRAELKTSEISDRQWLPCD
jgi:hypothetical protein